MSDSSNSSAMPLVVGAAVLLAAAAGGFLLLRGSSDTTVIPPVAAPAPVVATEGPAPAPAPAPVPESKGTESIAGKVLHGAEGQESVEGATVEVFAGEGEAVPFLAPLATGTTAADGTFTIGGLEKDGKFRVRASKVEMASAVTGVVGAADKVELRLLEATHVAGTVKDSETKELLVGARVSVGDVAGMTTGPDGAFRLERLPRGANVVTATAKDHVAATRYVDGSKKPKENLVLQLAPATWIEGTVLASGGGPAAGADVTVQEFSAMGMLGRMATGNHEGKAGADGKFRIENLPVGKEFEISARNDEGLSAPVKAGPLHKGSPAEGIVLQLAPGATLVVTVLDEAGKPIEGASVGHEAGPAETGSVEALEKRTSALESRASRLGALGAQAAQGGATTDAQGIARLRPVPPGPTRVTASKQDLVSGEGNAMATAGAETSLTVSLTAGVTLTGTVVDGDGAPVAEAQVNVMRFKPGSSMTHESRPSAADGTFKVGGLAGKGFQVQASKTGFVQTMVQGIDPATGPVTITLQKGGTISGLVVDEGGKAVPAFSVSSKRTDRKGKADAMSILGDMGGTAVDDKDGKFKIEGLDPGVYTVTARAAEFAPGRTADVKVESGAVVEVRVVLPVGLTLSGIIVRKSDETPVEGASVSVARPGMFGNMDVDFDMEGMGLGDEVGDAEGMKEAFTAMGGGKGAASSGADGRFTLKGLEAGKIDIKVKAKDFAPTTQKGVVVPAEGDVRIAVADGAAIEGVVYDAQRAPKPGVMVMLQKLPMTMKVARTDDKGHYRIAGLAPGKYLYYAMDNPEGMFAGGLNMKSESVTLEEGKTLVKDHRLGDGVKVTGKVTRGGKPVPDAMVMMLPGAGRKDAAEAMMGGSGFAMATTKEDGSYEISGLAPGVYTAMVGMGPGGGPAPGDPVEIRAGATEVKRDIALARNMIRGIVVDGDGKPVSGVQVQAVAAGKNIAKAADLGEALSSMGGQATTGDDGRFAMEDMNAGTFTLRVRGGDHGSGVVENVVPSESGTDIRLVLEKGVEVTVKVLDADGKPVAGAGVYLSDPGGDDLSGTDMDLLDPDVTGADGKVVVTAPAGTVHFEALIKGYAPGVTVATAAAGAEVTITLPRGASVDVLVTDAGGNPVNGAGVRLLDSAGNPYASRMTMEGLGELLSTPTTGSDGKYSRGDLPAGSYIVRAAVGERTADVPVTLGAGERKSVTVRLP